MATANIDAFLNDLQSHTPKNTFNPWVQKCEFCDCEQSPEIRVENLRHIIEACLATESVDLWVGRDLGWRGGRRTGVPLVDEISLLSYGKSLKASRLRKATVDMPMKERTATEVDLARARTSANVFFWNVFPYHPHAEGNYRTNRLHNRSEKAIGEKILLLLLAMLPKGRVIAIGNDAAHALFDIGVEALRVRHPSYGGQKSFHAQINAHYNITVTEPQPGLL